GLGAVAQSVTGNTFEKETVRFSEPTIQNADTYLSVALNEANSFLMKQDKPLLPSYSKVYTFPFGTTIQSVTVTPQNIQMQTLSKDIEPTPQYVIIGQTTPANKEAPINYGAEVYPSSWFGYTVGCGLYDGELSIIVNVDVYPIQYHPVEKVIESAQQVDIVIQYTTTTPQTSPLADYQLVVIGPAGYSSQIAPLITHKIGRGITSKFVSLDDIYAGTYFPATGRDNQEKIKYFIKNAIESWLTGDILLVGAAGSGSTQLPVRDTHVYIDGTEPDNEIFSSDLYYADIYNGTGGFCSWDSNNNNIFGEYDWSGQTDAVDLHPDVYLARLPTTSSSQVTACVNKIKTYENTPGYQQSWFTNFVVVGGDTFPDSSSVDEGEYKNQKVIDTMVGFVADKLWASNGKLSGWAPTGVANIKSAINAGCGFVDFSGHGNTNIWATHPHDDFGTWIPTPAMGIKSSDIQTLSNGNKLPIVAVDACSTAKFASDTNCFNWAFLYNSNGGAIGTFGCTGLGWGIPGSGYTSGLVGKMSLDTFKAYKIDQATTFGEMWSRALNRYIKSNMDATDYKMVEEWQAFGDPTLTIGEQSQPKGYSWDTKRLVRSARHHHAAFLRTSIRTFLGEIVRNFPACVPVATPSPGILTIPFFFLIDFFFS
ncbi:MAG: C25 family cysteine peptidase, partial [Euryarchaeota archaeon]|nr:C25 family cysteine peptidase [Euryarchaeota archaeon]